ncbi:MAG: hypothetical protein ABIN61_00385 [candidate division WOR-3 bacterium]
MILSTIILGFLGWVIALLLLYRNIKIEGGKSYKAVHLSAIKDGRVGELFKFGILEGIPVISEKDIKKIDEFLESNELPEGFKDRLRIFKGLKPKVIKEELPLFCRKLGCPAVVSGEVKDELEIQGIKCIDIKVLDKIGRPNLLRGEKIRVNYVDYGYDKAEGFLEDGTIVEIKGNFPEERPVSIECIVEGVIESKFKRKVFARFKGND